MGFGSWLLGLLMYVTVTLALGTVGAMLAVLLNFGDPRAVPKVVLGFAMGCVAGLIVGANLIYGADLLPFLVQR